MKILLLTAGFIFLCALTANAQTNDIAITRDEAIACDKCLDSEKALKVENETLKKGYSEVKTELVKMQIEFARVSGELTGAKNQLIQYEAMFEVLLRNVKKKKFGLVNIF